MKKLIPFLSFAIVATACNQAPPAETAQKAPMLQEAAPPLDTAGLAEYQYWKAQNELARAEPAIQPQAAVQPVKRTATPVKKATTPARKAVQQAPAPAPEPAVYEEPSLGDIAAGGSGTAGEGTGAGSGTEAPAVKKGMSKSTKGAIIGAAGGAIAGAVINKKNRAVGAVIGGVIGAGGGYVIGKKMDQKDQQ